MNTSTFSKLAESLRQYRRAELRDFKPDVGEDPVDLLYVDPLPSDAVLNTVLSGNTTFLLGRKGSGKSTVFAKAQSAIRRRKDLISIYIDVKSLHEILAGAAPAITDEDSSGVDEQVLRAHLLRKHFIAKILEELLLEVTRAADQMSIVSRWIGRGRTYKELHSKLTEKANQLEKTVCMTQDEIPILRKITTKARERKQQQESERTTSGIKGRGKLSLPNASVEASGELESEDYNRSLNDRDLYRTYSDVVLKSYPYASILREIQDLLDGAGLTRLVVFFDDFSEIGWTDQRLFVDVVLAPLNNSSNERVKLKIAGYPGRVYYGKIDPSKVDTLSLDFASLYRSQDIQTAEAAAIEYTARLLEKRFDAFGLKQVDYIESSLPLQEFHALIFQTTANVPRLIGFLLHQCYLDRISKKQKITAASIRLASEKYYTTVVSQYFDQMSRFALEPFSRKIDRHNQKKLLDAIISEAKEVRKKIRAGEIGGTYFAELTNPGVSHFTVSPELEKVLASLEFNFLLTKYSDMRDKDAKDVSVYALFYGLCESERLPWGYPRGREYRNYFVQRVFDFNHVVHQFLSKTKTIRCDECEACFPIDRKDSFELFHWKCPECGKGKCEIINVSDDFKSEVTAADNALMLEPVELSILNVLHDENRPMRAGEISQLLDVTHQLVGKRTAKLADRGLVQKKNISDAMRSTLTNKADRYFQKNE